jgi:hypothetical protein
MTPQSSYRVSNVNEAVELAKQLKQEGVYDWFRGQTQNWRLSSSFMRLDEAAREKAKERIMQFVEWTKITPGLESLVQHADSAIAVAQHYGIHTNFVDFTTEPEIAGFFASHGTPPTENKESCIICLDTRDLTEFWVGFPPEYVRTETLVIDVSNLWRLQAQYGVFLFFPYDARFEKSIYHFDRIIFPYTGPISSLHESRIYPERKSQLEILLDQFFMNEALVDGNQFLKRTFTNVWDAELQLPQIPYIPEMLVDGELPPIHETWQDLQVESWLRQEDERYHGAVIETPLKIEVDSSKDVAVIIDNTASLISNMLSQTKELRQRLVNWSLVDRNGVVFEEEFMKRLRQLWDGLRSLPYSDNEIALAMGRCTGLIICSSVHHLSWKNACSACFGGEVLEVEFGSGDGSYSRAFVNRGDLMNAVREDIQNSLSPDFVNNLGQDINGLLQAIKAPQYLFNFQRLADLFAGQIVPSQVLTRSVPGALFYSPARLKTFGKP